MNDPLKILVLEDSADDAEMVLQVLKRTGLSFESRWVVDEPGFLAALDEFGPQLILSDNSLPQFSASEALAITRTRFPDLPFILVTGTVSDEFAAGIIKLGADDYILKDRLERLPAAIDAAVDKRRSEAAARARNEEKRFNASLLAAVGQAIIATNLAGTVIYWNQAAEQIYGWTAGEAIGRNILDITPALQAMDQAIEIMKQLRAGNTWSGEVPLRRKDGTVFPAFVTDSPIYDQDGNLSGIIGVSSDITDRKKSEQELKAMEQQILRQKIQEQKKISRAIIKAQEQQKNHIGKELHDNVTQILAGTKLFLAVAAKKSDAVMELVRYPIELIEKSIDEIRLLSSNSVTPLRNVDLEKLITLLVDNLTKGTTIRTEFSYNVPGALTDDELKLNIYRIVQEQVNNIIKHAAPQNVRIRIVEENAYIRLEVTDDGKGFDLSRDRKGIGISNMINRVESFNGKMEMNSSPGKGCRLQVSLPLKGENI